MSQKKVKFEAFPEGDFAGRIDDESLNYESPSGIIGVLTTNQSVCVTPLFAFLHKD